MQSNVLIKNKMVVFVMFNFFFMNFSVYGSWISQGLLTILALQYSALSFSFNLFIKIRKRINFAYCFGIFQPLAFQNKGEVQKDKILKFIKI